MQCLEESEGKSDGKRSPLMFESDEELIDDKENLTAENQRNPTKTVNCYNSSTVLNERKPLSKEEHLINRLQTILTGIPPPPAVTVPQIDCDDILKLWRANEQLVNEYKKCMPPGASEQEKAAVEQAARSKWPEVSHCQCMGVSFNKGSVSEELEYLSAKYKERYIGNETSSCVNSLYTKQTTLTASARKRARHRNWGQSPGRRLSHLARRRKAFTSANLQSVAESNAKYPEKKMILIDVRKSDVYGIKRSSSKKQSLLGKSDSQKVNSSKRALFQSPEVNRNRNLLKHNKNLKCSPKSVRVQRSKRALWPSSCKKVTESEVNNGKREGAVSKTSPHKKCNRNLFINKVRELSSSNGKSHKKACNFELKQACEKPNCSGLSSSHRQKLLWAISNALRDEGIRMIHDKFRPCASVLFKVCQKLWLERRQKMTNEKSTSENMLALARQFSSKVVYYVEKDPSNINLAELCSDLIKAAVAEQLVEKNMSLVKCGTSKNINVQSIMDDNVKKLDSTTKCELGSENCVGSNNKNRTESLECSIGEVEKDVCTQESSYILCTKDESKPNFVYIEDEETKFSVLKNDSNISNYDNGLRGVDVFKQNISSIKNSFTVQSSANFSVGCDDVSNETKGFNLNTKAVPSYSRTNKINGLNCLNDKRRVENAATHSMSDTLIDTVSDLNSNDRISTFTNLIKDNIVSVENVVNIPFSEMLSWNADPISRLKSNTTVDVFGKDSLPTKVNLNVMSHWQNLVTIKENKQKTGSESLGGNYSDTKLTNFCSLESTVDTECSSSVNSNTITNYDFSGIISESESWFQSDQHEMCDVVHL